MRAYFHSIWDCRDFWLSLVKMDLRNRYRGSALGVGWSLLHPVMMTAILCAVFCELFGQNIREYAPFLLAGLATWNYLVSICLEGCHCFLTGQSYIRQYRNPIAIYPLRTTLGATIHFLIALGIVLIVDLVIRGFDNLLIIPFIIYAVFLLFLFGWSLSAITGFLHTFFHDTRHILEILFQLLFYITPVMYKAELLERHHMGWAVICNPAVPMMDLIRQPLVNGVVPSTWTIAASGAIVLITIAVALPITKHLDQRVIFYL